MTLLAKTQKRFNTRLTGEPIAAFSSPSENKTFIAPNARGLTVSQNLKKGTRAELKTLRNNVHRIIYKLTHKPGPLTEASARRSQDYIDAVLDWILLAQNQTPVGGVSQGYRYRQGWLGDYPETTGYIVATLLEQTKRKPDAELEQHAKAMLDWLVSLQFADGSFQGGTVVARPVVPVTFNTGQILIGLAAGADYFSGPSGQAYASAMKKAADWLVATQEADGAWRQHPSPFAMKGDRAYDAHIVVGLLGAARVGHEPSWSQAARKNIDWVVSQQRSNGWLTNCCLSQPGAPLTHTLGYALKGILDSASEFDCPHQLKAALALAEGLLSAKQDDGFLPGRLQANFQADVSWACLPGSAQIAECWLLIYQLTGDVKWRDGAEDVLAFVRQNIALDGPSELKGAVPGSAPFTGGYMTMSYPNWGAKFFIDAQQLALDITYVEKTSFTEDLRAA